MMQADSKRLVTFDEDELFTMQLGEEVNQVPDEIQHNLKSIALDVNAIVIDDASQYEQWAVELRDAIAPQRRALEGYFKPIKDKYFALHRRVCAQENEIVKRIAEMEQRVKSEMSAFLQRQKKERDEAARRAHEEAMEKERAARAEKVETLIAQGDTQAAERVIAEPVRVLAPTPKVEDVPKVAGISTKEQWKAEVTDLCAFLRWLGSGSDEEITAKSHLISVEQSELNKLAAANRQLLNVPGVRAFTVDSIRAGKARR